MTIETAALQLQSLRIEVYEPGSNPNARGGETTFSQQTTFTEATTFAAGGPLGAFRGDEHIASDASFSRGVGNSIDTADIEIVDQTPDFDLYQHGNIGVLYVNHELLGGEEKLATLRMADYEIRAGVGAGPTEVSVTWESWLWSTLADRRFSGAIRDEPLSDAIQRVLDAVAPDVALAYNLVEDPVVSNSFDATPASTAIDSLVADRGVLAGGNQTLRVEPVNPDKGPASLDGSDLRMPSRRETDSEGLYSRVRIDGGDLAVPQPRAIEPVVDEYRAVPLDDVVQTQLPIAVSELDGIELATRHSNPDGTLVVRLQADEGGEPTAPDNPDQDIAQRRLDSNFVSPDGTTRFEFPEHTIPDRDPWLLIGHETGADNPGDFEVGGAVDDGSFRPATPTVDARKPLVLVAENDDAPFGERHTRIREESIASFDEANARAQRELNRHDSPETEVNAGAGSDTAHNLELLDAPELDLPSVGQTGERLFVRELEDTISGTLLTRTITLYQPAGFDPGGDG
jgi:hypothetical protein